MRYKLKQIICQMLIRWLFGNQRMTKEVINVRLVVDGNHENPIDLHSIDTGEGYVYLFADRQESVDLACDIATLILNKNLSREEAIKLSTAFETDRP